MGQRIKGRRGSSINHLPEEILGEILVNSVNSPVKSLLRFKCVSKPWRASISSNRFTEEHLQKSSDNFINRKLIYKFVDQKNQPNFRSCSLKSLVDGPKYSHFSTVPTTDHGPIGNSPSSSIRIEGSCNGLILLSFDERDLLVWNPATGLFKHIPPPSYTRPKRPHSRDLDRFVYGFGYDYSTRDYQIVYIFYFYIPNRYGKRVCGFGTEIYSLRRDSWKRIENFEKAYHPTPSSGELVNGKLHWVGRKYPSKDRASLLNFRRDLDHCAIVGLDLGDEEYEIVGLPQCFSGYDDRWERRVLNLGGYLGMSCANWRTAWETDVWVMMKYGDAESWNKIWRQAEYPGRNIGEAWPIWFRENEGYIAVFYLRNQGDIAVGFANWVEVYNVKNKSLKSGVYVPDGELRGLKCYVESLVSPFGNQSPYAEGGSEQVLR